MYVGTKLEKTPPITRNNYNGFKTDILVQYGNYRQPWKLDSGGSGYHCGPNTGKKNRRKKRNGIKEQVKN